MSTRRRFISQTAAAASAMAFPLVGGAQPKSVKIGVLHPVTGALAYSGQQCRVGAQMAIEDINKAGGIKSHGRREDRGPAGRRAVHAAGGHGRSREDERGRRLGRARRLCLGDLPGHHAGGRQVQPAARRGRGRGRPDRRARPEEHLPLRPGLPQVRRDRHGQPARAQHGRGQAGQDRDDHPRGVAVRHRHGRPAGARAAGLRLRGQGSDQARQPDARLQQHRAAHEGAEPGHRDPGQLLQRIRAAGAHHAAAEGDAQGDLLRAGRRGLQLQVRQGVPGRGQRHHRLQPLVQPEGQALGRAAQAGGGQGPVLQLRDLQHVHGHDAAGRRPRSRQERRPRRHHRCAREEHLLRPFHALRPDEVRQRPEHGRPAADDAGRQERHQGDRAARVPRDRPGVPAAG